MNYGGWNSSPIGRVMSLERLTLELSLVVSRPKTFSIAPSLQWKIKGKPLDKMTRLLDEPLRGLAAEQLNAKRPADCPRRLAVPRFVAPSLGGCNPVVEAPRAGRVFAPTEPFRLS